MTNNEKELHRVQYDDLAIDVQKRIDSAIYNDSEAWILLTSTIKSFSDSINKLLEEYNT